MLYLVSPGEPKLGPAVNKNYQRFVDVSRLDIVQLHTVDCHVLVLPVLGVQQTGGRAWSRLDMEQFPPSLKQPEGASNEEHWNGNDEANDDRQDSCPFYHLRSHCWTYPILCCSVCWVDERDKLLSQMY